MLCNYFNYATTMHISKKKTIISLSLFILVSELMLIKSYDCKGYIKKQKILSVLDAVNLEVQNQHLDIEKNCKKFVSNNKRAQFTIAKYKDYGSLTGGDFVPLGTFVSVWRYLRLSRRVGE